MRYPSLDLQYIPEDGGWTIPGFLAPLVADRRRIATVALFGDPRLDAPIHPTAAAGAFQHDKGVER